MSNCTASIPAIEYNNSSKTFLNVSPSEPTNNPFTEWDSGVLIEVLHRFPINTIDAEREVIKKDIATLSKTALRTKYSSEYNSFHSMYYERCGKKGGYICHPSINTFPKFLLAFGTKPAPGWTIDRKDPNNVEYSPEKCEWVSKQRQSENRRNVKQWTHSDGRSRTCPEWSRTTRIPYKTMYRRLNDPKWTVDQAVEIPLNGKRKNSPPKKSDANCKSAGDRAGNGRTYIEFCDENETYNDPLYIPPRIAPTLVLLNQILVQEYEEPFFAVEVKHLKMMRDIFDLLEPSLDPKMVLACIVNNWGSKKCGFVEYACKRGSFNPPEIPTVQFIRGNVNAAGNFYLQDNGLLQHYATNMPQLKLEEKYRAEMSAGQIAYNLKCDFPDRNTIDEGFLHPSEWRKRQEAKQVS